MDKDDFITLPVNRLIERARNLLAGQPTSIPTYFQPILPPDITYKFQREVDFWQIPEDVSIVYHPAYFLAMEAWRYAELLHTSLTKPHEDTASVPTSERRGKRRSKRTAPLVLRPLRLIAQGVEVSDESMVLVQTAPDKYQLLGGHELYLNYDGRVAMMKRYLLPKNPSKGHREVLDELVAWYTKRVLFEIIRSTVVHPWMLFPEFRCVLAYILITFRLSSLLVPPGHETLLLNAWNLPRSTYDYYTQPLRKLTKYEPLASTY